MARVGRTAKQRAASKRNLMAARKARSRNASGSSGGLGSMGTASAAKARAFARKPKGASAQNAGSKAASASWEKRQSGLAPSTLLKKYNSSLKSAAAARTDAGRSHHEAKAEVFWKAYKTASKSSKRVKR